MTAEADTSQFPSGLPFAQGKGIVSGFDLSEEGTNSTPRKVNAVEFPIASMPA
jgi:hypothetical protein